MKYILEFADYRNQTLNLGRGIILSNFERIQLGRIIREWLVKIYGENLIGDSDFSMLGQILKPEYLRKAINNRNLFKKLVYDDRREIYTGVKNKNELLDFVRKEGRELFSPDGKYFKSVYSLLTGSSIRGASLETKAFELLKSYFMNKDGIDVEIAVPTIDEDLSGVDGKFQLNGEDKTVQVKPLHSIQEYKIDNTKFIVFCDGVLKGLITDYLVVSNNKESHIFTTDGIIVKSSYFLIPKVNLLS